MSLINTNTRLIRPTPKSSAEVKPGRHRANEEEMAQETKPTSPERRAAVLRPEFPMHDFPVFVPAVAADPDPEPVVEVKPGPIAVVKDRIARNIPKRWFRR